MKRKTSQLLKLLGGLPFWVKGNSLKISFWVFDVSCQFQGEKLYFNKPNKEHGLNPSIFVSYRICFQTNHLIIQNISTDGDSQPCVVVPSHPVHHRPDHVRRNPEGNHQETPWRLDRGWNLLFTIVMITNMIQTIIMITNMIQTIVMIINVIQNIIMKRKKSFRNLSLIHLYFITSRVCILYSMFSK